MGGFQDVFLQFGRLLDQCATLPQPLPVRFDRAVVLALLEGRQQPLCGLGG